ncbi:MULTISPECIES: transcriptional activator NhaR [Methylosinus]|uniref:Transcriptional activator NhaR n=1 Tax=Methylosinus trichosporium (strain ATCC 35070 / NCIMB 11131 / UNIQEM 75 / OB3b) TaxID=595536 RepID=A0A2D2D4V3_METT3|nr:MULTISPECIES: transcriptional activator NhaR [Methylosinus]ATQ70038.1 transcriptional activator NhaR [Methylosinus trichosporium OB3b]OBS50420.1 LysR family transcriptional regulator [Methylosinus sp. 3S-1]
MDRLNYQHLFYFWNVVREGGVSRASEKLRLAQPTISGQLAVFEKTIGAKLFLKQGRNLVMTETGRTVFNYADEIFSLGRELAEALDNRPGARGQRLSVGVSNALHKLLVYRLLEPALNSAPPAHLICFEDKLERLLTELPVHGVDLVISDAPATSAADARIYNHLLGESAVAAFATPALHARCAEGFPHSLDGAPLLLPTTNTALRRSLDQWLDAHGLFPDIVAEIEDSALLKTFASAGAGLFMGPVAMREAIERQYGVELIGTLAGVSERFYAITAQRKVKHPCVAAILERARDFLTSPA